MDSEKGKIMLVEDSQNLRYVLRDYLEMLNYRVSDFKDGISALKSFSKGKYNIAIFDVVMPEKDGFELMHDIRRIDKDIPIIFLTAKDSKEDKIKAFKLGCDDYVVKPFSMEELTLRIEAVLRRTKSSSLPDKELPAEVVYKFGSFVFNYNTLKLEHPKTTRTLTRKEAELMKLLCEHQNRLIPREVILKEIWGDEDYSVGRSMDVFLTKLRSYIHIEDVPKEFLSTGGGRRQKYKPEYEPEVEICNVHGTGFILKVKK